MTIVRRNDGGSAQQGDGTVREAIPVFDINLSAGGLAAARSTDTTVTPTSVTLVAATSNTLLAANASRIRFRIINPLATTLFVRLAASAATASAGGYDLAIPAGGSYISDPYEYLGQIRGINATAGDIAISESV